MDFFLLEKVDGRRRGWEELIPREEVLNHIT